MHSLFTDGGARGNPGPAAAAAVLLNEQEEIVARDGKYVGADTNNFAEYTGLVLGLNLALANGVTELKCHLDSELIVMQMNGAYRVKEKRLKEMWDNANALVSKFADIKFVHVRREKNKIADKMVNEILDATAAGKPVEFSVV